MAITSAVQRGQFVYIYNEKHQQCATVSAGGSHPNDGLKGYTSSTVSVQRGAFVYVHDEHGRQISTHSAGR